MADLAHLDLCAGYGGMSLAMRLLFGSRIRSVGYVEREAFSASILAARMAEGFLDAAPCWSDLQDFPGSLYRGKVDIVTAGFPCQPFSDAGHRRGLADERWLWPSIERVLADVRPVAGFFENVPGLLLRGGMPEVVRSLASLGYAAEWAVLGADSLGAPHQRKRVWILAYAPDQRWQILRSACQGGVDAQPRSGGAAIDGADPDGAGRAQRGLQSHQQQPAGRTVPSGGRWWAVEPSVDRVVDGYPGRVDECRALGNGVLPVVAARAFWELSKRTGG